jgi:sulfide:quinone oxidoreductase
MNAGSRSTGPEIAMHPRRLSDILSVSRQIGVDDIGAIAGAGFRSIVCNRPDDEDPGQPQFATIAAAAAAVGLRAVHQPVASGAVTATDGVMFASILADLPKPVLAYCRSGARSTTLWTLCQADAGYVAPHCGA